MKTTACTLLFGFGWVVSALADPAGGNGIWINPPGWIGECFVCPNDVTSDCMDAEPVFLEIDHNRRHRSIHVTQRYPVAWSEETGLQYKGTLTLTVQYYRTNQAMAVVTVHWLREDGLRISTVQHIRLRYVVVNGRTEIVVMQEHDMFTCQ